MARTTFILLIVSLFITTLGCSNKCKVSGKVTFSDGSPLTAGTVIFDNGTDQAKGSISETGTYQLSSHKNNDGIAPGEYGVYITGAFGFKNPVDMKPGTVPRPDNLIDTRFTSKSTSGLRCVVKGATVFNIEVTPPEGK